MSDDVVRARIDAKTKKKAVAVLEKIGLTPSGAFRMLMVRIAAEKRLPFAPLEPNAKTITAIKASRRGEGRNVGSIDQLMEELNSK
ncbi:MAG: type II toxin-antitoxin system RelB/DinJ family antitoxin [Hyphomicrobium sp.]|nr:type II toxin-antitoxin system RelB/DinJ family antitoxin [Hyphomicrobium sp.]